MTSIELVRFEEERFTTAEEFEHLEVLARGVIDAWTACRQIFPLFAKERRTESWLRRIYGEKNLGPRGHRAVELLRDRRRCTPEHADKVLRGALRAVAEGKDGKSNAQRLGVFRRKLLEVRRTGRMVEEVNNILKAMQDEVHLQLATGRKASERRRLRRLAEDLAHDLGLDES